VPLPHRQSRKRLQDFVEALRELSASDERLPYARQRVAELEKRVPRLRVTLPAGAPSGTIVLKDGVEMPAPTFGMALPVDPGTVTLVTRAPGRAPKKLDVAMAEGQTQSIEIVLGDAGPASVPGADGAGPPGGGAHIGGASPSSGATWRTVGLVVAGVGAAALATGAVTGILALNRASAYRSACGPSFACSDLTSLQSAQSAASDAKTLSTVSTVTFVAGAVAAAGGLTLYFTHPASSAPRTGAPSSAGHGSAIGVSATPGGVLGVWRATF
jgi:hypothetical protein